MNRRLELALKIVKGVSGPLAQIEFDEDQVVSGVNVSAPALKVSASFIFEEDGVIALKVYDERWSESDPRSVALYRDKVTIEEGVERVKDALKRNKVAANGKR